MKQKEAWNHKVALFVHDENKSVQQFYKKAGWIEVREAKAFAKKLMFDI